MASPTRWFRKHSKILIVILAVFAMAIFGLGDAIFSLTRPQPTSEFKNDTIATWGNNQPITRRDLAILQERHFQAQRFLEQIQKTAFEIKKDEYRPLAEPVPAIQGDDRFAQSMIDEQLIDRFILARKAEKEGFVYSDAMLDEYLDMLSGQVGLTPAQLAQINRDVNTNRSSYEAVRRHLRQELLAQQMRMFANAGYQVRPNPSESAELYQQYTELVDCEILPVDVDQFSNVDTKPSAMDLKKLYDQGKYDYSDPSGRRPGFKRPNRVAVQFIMGDYETFTQNEINKLTDEQVQTEYDRLVAEKSDLVMEDVPEAEQEKNPDSGEIKLPGLDSEGSKDKPADSNADGNSQPETPLTLPNANEEKQSPTESDPDKNPGASVRASRSAFQYVSLRQDGEAGEPDPTGAEPTPSESETTTQEPANNSGSTDDKPAETTPESATESATESAPADKPADASTTPATETPAAQETGNQSSDIGSMFAEDKTVEKRPRPLTSVADIVKRSMVREKVNAAIEKAMKSAEEQLDMFQSDLAAWESLEPETRGPQPNVEYQVIADRLGLTFNESELMDFEAFNETSLGQVIAQMNFGGQPRFLSVAQRIFGDFDRMNKYASERVSDFRNLNQYVYWVKDKKEAALVPFEECKAEVEKFWKRNLMVEQATTKAEGMAANANTSQKTLAELFGENVSRTGEFSWFDSVSGGFGRPIGVKNPGSEFMKSVFALETGKTGVAVNSDRSVVYLVRMVSERKDLGTLGTEYVEKQFLPKKAIPREVLGLSQQYAQEYNMEWNQELHDEMGLKFLGR